MSFDPAVPAADLYAAARQATPIAPLREQFPDLDETQSYAVQQALLDLLRAGGAQRTGAKIGATNPAALAAFGLKESTSGELFTIGAVADGGVLASAGLIHPKIECEVAFRLKADLVGPHVTPEQAAAAVESVHAAFEVADARTAGWNVKMPEMIADNVFQANYVLAEGLPLAERDLAAETVTLLVNGTEAARGAGANVLGSPLNALAWLANHLAARGKQLYAGDIVLAGSLTPLVAIKAGDQLEAVFSSIGSVRLTLV